MMDELPRRPVKEFIDRLCCTRPLLMAVFVEQYDTVVSDVRDERAKDVTIRFIEVGINMQESDRLIIVPRATR